MCEMVTAGAGKRICIEFLRAPRRDCLGRDSRKRAQYGQRGKYWGRLHLVCYDSKMGCRWGKAGGQTGEVGRGQMMAVLDGQLTNLGFTPG